MENLSKKIMIKVRYKRKKLHIIQNHSNFWTVDLQLNNHEKSVYT